MLPPPRKGVYEAAEKVRAGCARAGQPPGAFKEAVSTVSRMISTAVDNPLEDKYRRVKTTSKTLNERY